MVAQLKPLHEQVMVITGASSGIGLATAEAAAQKGVCLVLAGRSDQALENVAGRINAKGGQAIAVHCVPAIADRLAAREVDRQQYQEPPRNAAGILRQSSESSGTAGRTHGAGGKADCEQ